MIIQLGDGSVVSVSAAIGQMLINSGRGELYAAPVFEFDTFEVGEAGEHGGIEEAWAAIADRRLDKDVVINVADGEYPIEGLLIENHPDAHRIKILGNVENPAACKLMCGGGGIFFNNIRGLEFSGFSITGAPNQTQQGLVVDEQSRIYSAENSIQLSNCKIGLTVTGLSAYEGMGLILVDCETAVNVEAATANIEHAVITGIDGVSQSGLVAVDGGFIEALESSINDVRYGVRAQTNGKVKCDKAVVENCYVGFFAERGGVISNNEDGIARGCDFGFAAQRNGEIAALEALADDCDYGFVAYYAAHLYASESTAKDSTYYGYSVYGGSLLEAWQTNGKASGNGANYRLSSGSTGAANSILFYS